MPVFERLHSTSKFIGLVLSKVFTVNKEMWPESLWRMCLKKVEYPYLIENGIRVFPGFNGYPLLKFQKQDVLGPLSVMVWFHGGGWECGAGISAFYGPKYLLDHDVVFVSGNFRLGPLGFLSTETSDCPGNFGLKDQVMVLKWVQENIAAFGGDPSSVTIFGESAGGASATYHMISPATRGELEN